MLNSFSSFTGSAGDDVVRHAVFARDLVLHTAWFAPDVSLRMQVASCEWMVALIGGRMPCCDVFQAAIYRRAGARCVRIPTNLVVRSVSHGSLRLAWFSPSRMVHSVSHGSLRLAWFAVLNGSDVQSQKQAAISPQALAAGGARVRCGGCRHGVVWCPVRRCT
jgi:hypothetical protein